MAKTRKTELDIDFDIKTEEIAQEQVEEVQKAPEEEKKKKPAPKFKLPALSQKVLILLITSVLGILLLVSGIIYFWYKAQLPVPEKPMVKKEPIIIKKIPQYQFAPFFLPIKTNSEDYFLKIAFSLDLSSELAVKEIEQNVALLRGNLSFLLGKKSLKDLRSDSYKTKLSLEIINMMNRSLQNGTVKNVYFTQFFLK